MNLDEFKEYLNSKNQEATILLESLTSEADRLDELEHQIKNMDDYEHFLKAAKAITDDAQGDIEHANSISDEIFSHSDREEFYPDCYMEFLTISFALKCCGNLANRIEDTAKHIVNKYGVILQHVHGMEFNKIIAVLPDFNDVIEYIAVCNEMKSDQIVTPEDKKVMVEKEVDDLDIPDGEPYCIDESDIPEADSKFAGKNIRFAELDDDSFDENEHDHVIGIVDGKEDLPKHPYTNNVHYVYVSFDKDTSMVTTWYFDHLLMDWKGESWKLTRGTFEDYVQSVKVNTNYTPNGLEIFGFARELDDLPLHNKNKGAIWAVRNGCDEEFNPLYIYYAWDETEDGTPYYHGFTGKDGIWAGKDLWGGIIIQTVSWNGFKWVDSVCYSCINCRFIDVSKSFNEVNNLDDCYCEVNDAVKQEKIPIKVLYLDHEDGNTTIEPYAYSGKGIWVRAIPIDKSTKECTEEFVHDWKEAHNK